MPLTQDQVQTDALSVTMVVPKERYSTGDMIEVFLRVTNLTNHPITIPAMTSPRVQVVMYRDTPVGWQRLQEYPGGVLELDRSWVLAPGERVLSTPVVVGPEFPTGSYVRLEGRLSGLPDFRPAVTVWIQALPNAGLPPEVP